jgi:iron complex transport system ATP-binding protein
MSRSESLVVIRSLTFAYRQGGNEVLHGISLEIQEGTITAILGPNGSGKTTLLNLLLGWLVPQKGSIELAGKPHRSYSRRAVSRLVGLVPQDEHATFDLTVIEYVLLGRAPYLEFLEMPQKSDRELAFRALEAAGLTSLRDRPISSLSSGERQLATVARALAQEPRIMLLDEPLSHLDLGNTRRILQILASLKKRGETIIFTTHDPNIAASVADGVILLKEGRLLASGPAIDVLKPENLNLTYGVEVEVIKVNGRLIIVPPVKDIEYY